MRIAVTGLQGQLAKSLAIAGPQRGCGIVLLGRPELDLARPETIAPALERARPDLVVSAAAYTAVDQAEDDRETAFAVNAAGPGALARAACAMNVPVLHVSTDYVFSGAGRAPYRESDPVAPGTVYGASKLAGEEAVLSSGARALVLRTSGVFAPFGTNFVRAMLRMAAESEELRVVNDQRGRPTYAPSLADALLQVGAAFVADARRPNEVLHAVGSDDAVWSEYAQAILHESVRRGGPSARVRPIPSSEYPTRATRPADSRLDSRRLADAYGVRLPGWRTEMPRCLDVLLGPVREPSEVELDGAPR